MKKLFIFIPIVFLFVIGIAYKDLHLTFYQQDEWWGAGHLLTEGFSGYLMHYSLLGLIAGAGRPLAMPFQYTLYNLSLFNTGQFAIFAVFFHFLNTLLLYFIVYKVTKSAYISFISGMFFATTVVAMQAVVWIGTNIATLPSVFFTFLSIYFYMNFLENEKKKYLYLSLCLAIVSYFFKESSIFLFLFLPFLFLLYKKKVSLVTVARKHSILIIYACLAIFLRLLELLTVFRGETATNVTGNSHSFIRLILHGIFYPFESLSQMFFSASFIFTISDYFGKVMFARLWNTPSAPIAIETIGAEMVSVIFSTVILVVLFIIYLYVPKNRKVVLFGLSLTFLSFLPYIPLEKGNAYLESRYYYTGIAGGGILLGVLFDLLRSIFVKRTKISSNYISIVLLVLSAIFFYSQVLIIQKDVDMQVQIATERKNFLTAIQTLRPRLENKTAFYITGNRDYYIEGNKVPFQQGMGYTLMVWYYRSGSIPKELLQQGFLWEIQTQGYKETENKGFGYYTDIKKLRDDMHNNKVKKENIIGLFYDANSQTLKEITNTIVY